MTTTSYRLPSPYHTISQKLRRNGIVRAKSSETPTVWEDIQSWVGSSTFCLAGTLYLYISVTSEIVPAEAPNMILLSGDTQA